MEFGESFAKVEPVMSSDLEGDLNQDGIIDEMDRVRENLDGDINELGERMKTMFDWRAYVRSAPLTSVAAAVVAGYLLAPKIRSRKVVVKSIEPGALPETKQSSGLGGTLWGLAMAAATRAGSAYVADLVTRSMGLAPAQTEQPTPTPSNRYPFDHGE